MKKILTLFAISPLALASCGGSSETIEYRYDSIECNGSNVDFINFEVKYNSQSSSTAYLVVKFVGEEAETVYLGNPYISEEFGNWYSRDLNYWGSSTSCEIDIIKIKY